MDEKLKNKLEEKIHETISKKTELDRLLESLSSVDNSKSFILGIIVGRLYNAFYYQTKRILNREPTKEEFEEFLNFLEKQKSDFENLW